MDKGGVLVGWVEEENPENGKDVVCEYVRREKKKKK
jgi:hypothetical protein